MFQTKSKRKLTSNDNQDTDLFVDAPADANSDDDSTDSEESVYSGLEEEEEEESSSEEEEDGGDEEEESEDGEQASSSESEAESEDEQDNQAPVDNKKASSLGVPLMQPPNNEYEHDSSDEEDIRSTVGNIPIEWYREFEHLGYDWDGKKIPKPKVGDRLDDFLNKMENPDYWRTVLDKMSGQNVVLSEQDVDLIERFSKGKYVDATYDPYEPWIDFFTHEKMIHPVTNHPAHKRSFIPSHLDRLKVGRMVHAIKMGWMKPIVRRAPEEETPNYYMLWEQEDQSSILKRHRQHLPAPKMPLPGHDESYNPPPEYLPTEEEIKEWEEKEPEERKRNFLPQKFSCLRQVPGYKKFINDRFQRCLDLYLCPRQQKIRMNVNPEDLLPKLPRPQDLQPFPSVQSLVYKGHTSLVRSITLDPTGQWMASGSDDGTVRLWEINTARCMASIQMGGVVRWLEWNPSPAVCLLAVSVENTVHILNPGLGDKLVIQNTDNLIETAATSEDSTGKIEGVDWQEEEDPSRRQQGFRLTMTHPKKIGQITWHHRGDYLAVVIPEGGSMSVLIHQLSKRRSQNPFRKSKGLVQRVLFHPTRPFLFMATQRYIRVYNLLKQQLTKKLMANCKWVSSLAVHPAGDNLVLGSYDCRTSWFDLDLSNKPYHTLRHHKKAIRQVAYHRTYPLFASASDDGTAIVCHGRVFSDLLQNPLIVPVKVLRGHAVTSNLGVLDCQFHPTQPWLFTAGADATIRLYS